MHHYTLHFGTEYATRTLILFKRFFAILDLEEKEKITLLTIAELFHELAN